jgi:hypothetical protein
MLKMRLRTIVSLLSAQFLTPIYQPRLRKTFESIVANADFRSLTCPAKYALDVNAVDEATTVS